MAIRGLLKRVERLEVRTAWRRRFIVQFGNLKTLPREYRGERHTVTLSQREDGWYEMEERPGPAPVSDDLPCDDEILRVCFVEAHPGTGCGSS